MRSYGEWMTLAATLKDNLDQSIADNNEKDVLYYRGKYLYTLKQAYKVDHLGIVPAAIRNKSTDISLADEINNELANHQRQIDASIRNNKQNSNIANPTFAREVGLKVRRLSTRCAQANFATGAIERKNAKKEIAKSALGLGGSALKAPIMVSSKVISKVGPLLISIVAFPFALFASFLSISIDAMNGKASDPNTFNNCVVTRLSNGIKRVVKSLSNVVYNNVGRL